MLIFNPKLFFILALILAAGFLLTPARQAPKTYDPKAVQWVAKRAEKSKAAEGAALLQGRMEEIKAGGSSQMNAVVEDDLRKPQSVGPPKNLGELTVEALVQALEAALDSVPACIPHLPLMPGLVHAFLKQDPEGIQFGPLPPNVLGQFSTADPMRPRITLSPELKRLHDKGVPTSHLVNVLIHEVDHMLTYILRTNRNKTRNENEFTAFRSEGLYLSSLRGKGDAVEAETDTEASAYYKDLKKVRRKLFAGELPQMIKESYGPDPQPSSHRKQ